MNAYVCQNLSKFPFNYVFKYITVNMFNLSYVNYISMKLLKISTAIDELCTGKSMSSNQGKPRLNPEGFTQETETDSQADGREAGSTMESERFQKEGARLLMPYTSSREAVISVTLTNQEAVDEA